jgi:glutamate-5-semialdehyde dehydrogenase
VRIPLGLIAMIYEARPNVTADAAALCFYAGNAVLLRGGSEAFESNRAIASALRAALSRHNLPEAAITLVEDLSRETMMQLLQLGDIVDLAIPRGGEGLIRFVAEHARVPVIKHLQGCVPPLCRRASRFRSGATALDRRQDHAPGRVQCARDPARACRRSACVPAARGGGVTRASRRTARLRTQPRARRRHGQRDRRDYAAEFLDLILAVRVVGGIDEAIAHIRRFGSDHTEVIATRDDQPRKNSSSRCARQSCMVNASSRFSDGGELGLGAEIGISTTRLHAYGPMGAEALTIERFVVRGTGQVRHPDA